MMKHSAGIIVVKDRKILLGHPGGPYYKGKSEGVWSMPKGCFDPQEEDALDAAIREFAEETGVTLPNNRGLFAALQVLPGKHKTLYPFVVNFHHLPIHLQNALGNPKTLKSNTCEIEFRGAMITIPEIDQFRWFGLDDVDYYISPRQSASIQAIREVLK